MEKLDPYILVLRGKKSKKKKHFPCKQNKEKLKMGKRKVKNYGDILDFRFRDLFRVRSVT